MMNEQVRNRVLARDEFRCQECDEAVGGKKNPHVRTANVHHKTPRESGGEDTPENLITLCKECHHEKHDFEVTDESKESWGKVYDGLDAQILDYLQEGRASPALVRAALDDQGMDVPTRQTINNRMKRMELAGHLNNPYDQGIYELVDDPREK